MPTHSESKAIVQHWMKCLFGISKRMPTDLFPIINRYAYTKPLEDRPVQLDDVTTGEARCRLNSEQRNSITTLNDNEIQLLLATQEDNRSPTGN